MPFKNPLGAVVQNIEYPGPQWVIDHCREAQYMTVCTLDDHRLAGRVQAEAGVPYTIARLAKFEPYPGDGATYPQIVHYAQTIYPSVKNVIAEAGNPNIHVQINCEQGMPNRQRLLMYVALMDIAAADPAGPVGMVFCNAGSGVIPTGFWGQSNAFAQEDFLTYLKTLDKYRHVRLKSGSYAFIHGSHPYTSQYPWIAVNGGKHRVPSWDMGNLFLTGKLHINWADPQDHLGREYQGIRKALGYVWDDATLTWKATDSTLRRSDGMLVQPPWIINTETFLDDMADVRNVHPGIEVYGNPYPKGWRSLVPQWEKHWFPGQPAGTTLANLFKWVWRIVDGPTGFIIGENFFTIGDTGPWDLDNITPGGVPNKDYFENVVLFRHPYPDHFFRAGAELPGNPPPVENPPPAEPPPAEPSLLFTPQEAAAAAHISACLDAAAKLNLSAVHYNTFVMSMQGAMDVLLAQPTLRYLKEHQKG